MRIFAVDPPDEVRDAYRLDPAICSMGHHESWSTWLEAQEPRPLEAPASPSSMIYTSGTTSNPKGVRRDPPTEANAATFGAMVVRIFGLGEDGDPRTAVTGPMYHSAPNAYGL